MSYQRGKHTFANKDEARAGIRDAKKMDALKKRGSTQEEIARNYLRQIKKQHIIFETYVGNDFVKRLNAIVTLEQRQQKLVLDEVIGKRMSYVISPERVKIKRLLTNLLYVLIIAVGLSIVIWTYNDYQSKKELQRLQNEAYSEARENKEEPQTEQSIIEANAEDSLPVLEKEILPELREMAEQNPEMAGWLRIAGTVIDYPVMYREGDNDYYLTHNFNKEEDHNGLLVMDKRCSPEGDGLNLLIHGHNMKSGAMFGTLDEYVNEAYYEEHPTIEFSTLYEKRTYDIFAVFRSSVYDAETTDFKFYNYIDIEDETEYWNYVDSVKAQSIYDIELNIDYGDRLINLSTCEYSKDNGRLVVVGREGND